ncbi:unnamed protein product [Adineta steineri]|uniref:Nuclear receptor domain-containing protein n=1 Tax=Adineta steineri TaxID=433720 RepID=A0A815BA80_9BILA|nr:unnamed protein product [Adineta steineri]
MMKLKNSRIKQKLSYPLMCSICGDIARGVNFSAASCMSCKMFFRRHAESGLLGQQCHFGGKCKITQTTRKFCAPCRLKLCFKVGMDPQLIRHSQRQYNNNNIRLPKLTTIGILNNDRSMLTLDEWNLLSNIINTYDEQNLLLQTKDFFKNQFSLPPKIRCKDSKIFNYIGSIYSTLYTFIEHCPLFYSLPVTIQKILIKRNLGSIGSFNALFISKEMNAFENESYSNLIDDMYGNGQSKRAIQASRRLDENGILIKIISILMIFSSNCTIISIDHLENIHIVFNPQMLLHIESLIVTMLWKYLIYQYGYKEGILRYVSLVKSILDMIQRMGDGLNVKRHWNMVENIAEEKLRLLSLKDGLSNN